MLLTLALIVSTACEDQAEQPANYDYERFSSYLIESNMDLDDVMDNWVISAPEYEDLGSFLNDHFIMDLRDPFEFANGHIEGAVNTSLATVLEDAEAHGDKTILLVDGTGQVSGHALVALRLSGFTDSKVLRFGMGGWNSVFSAEWVEGTSDIGFSTDSWSRGHIEEGTRYSTHLWKINEGSEQAWLDKRINTMLDLGFRGVEAEQALEEPDNYFINTVVDIGDIMNVGYIDGTHNYFPMSLKNNDFSKLNKEKIILTYCWDGCSSSVVTAYLTILGYDAYSLEFGLNGMIYSGVTEKKYEVPGHGLPYVTD